MSCDEVERYWQSQFDGEASEMPDVVRSHLAECGPCRAMMSASEPLRRALGRMVRPLPPAGLAARITASVLADRRARLRRRRRVWTIAGLAAGILVVVAGLTWLRPTGSGGLAPGDHYVAVPTVDSSKSIADANRPPAGSLSLRDEVATAGQAFATLVTRTADETVAKSRLLVPAFPPPVLPSAGADVLRTTFEPPARSLRETGQGVSSGIEPVTDSARRAVSMLLSHLPSMEDEP